MPNKTANEASASTIVCALERGDFQVALEMTACVSRRRIADEVDRLIDLGHDFLAVLLTFCQGDGGLLAAICERVDPVYEEAAGDIFLSAVDPDVLDALRRDGPITAAA